MEKEALLKIILQDIKELETLLNTFSGKPEIPKTFINLSKNKVKGILEEIDLLEELSALPITATTTEPHQPVITPTESTTDSIHIPQKEVLPKAPPHPITAPDIPKGPPVTETRTQKTTEQPKEPLSESSVPPKHHEKKTEPAKEQHPTILADKLGRDTLSFNEKLAQKKENEVTPRYQNKPIDDLKKGIGINDRFFFQRELFNGNAELMNQTLEQLNQMENFESAETFLTANFQWENNNEAVKAFRELVRRRYL